MHKFILSTVSFLLVFSLLLCGCEAPHSVANESNPLSTVTSLVPSSNESVSDTVTSNNSSSETSSGNVSSAEPFISIPETSSSKAEFPSSVPEPPNDIIFYNPISSVQAADPWITYVDGYYYGLYTLADKITLFRSKSLDTVFKSEKKTVMYLNDEVQGNIWAPELHYIPSTDRWYIYASGSTDGWDFFSIRMFCLESVTNDPFGEYVFKGFTDENTLAIDQTVFYDDKSETLYTAFSEFTSDGQVITLAVMDNPWTVSGTRIRISYPQYDWEKQGKTENKDERVNEGPVFLYRNDKLSLFYSASGCWSQYYCLGMLEFKGKDFSIDSVIDPKNWEKSQTPVFSAANGVYGVGHCSFFDSPNGETWIAYHGMATPDAGEAGRYTYVQPINFDRNGLPVLNEPLSRDTKIALP